nr:GM04983p [Drosophila melanogaster]
MEQKATVAQDKVSVAIRSLVQSDEMQELIKRIANERVRCNFLLATYQLPDMNFSLNTSMDTLRNQFRERLKQRRDRGNANLASSALSPASNRQKFPTKGVEKAKNP